MRSYQAQLERQRKQAYLQGQIQLAEVRNGGLGKRLEALSTILECALDSKQSVTFEGLKEHRPFRGFELPKALQAEPVLPPNPVLSIKDPDFSLKIIPGWRQRHERVLQEARDRYEIERRKYNAQVDDRNAKIKALRDQYDSEKARYEADMQTLNQEVNKLQAGYGRGDVAAIRSFAIIVLQLSKYPEGFPKEQRVAYLPDSRQLVIEYELPNKRIIPDVAEYRYVKSKDAIEEKLRKPAEAKELYQNIVAAICLRTLYEVLENDSGEFIDVVVFNGMLKDTDPATGKDIHPCLISVRTTKERFMELNLAKVDKKACLRNLGAQVSPQPAELLPVKPVVEFDMVDKRFVEESDVLSDIESRPNLMDLNPWEFENFINNLFGKIGFQAKLTRSAKDGGVDVVAFDPRPILGGKVVIQAKRYRNVVGVSAVRDLYGTMINEGASKGILVTTSHYGPDAYDFAKDKPIELIDGGGLLYLLEQNGAKARIVFPDDAAT